MNFVAHDHSNKCILRRVLSMGRLSAKHRQCDRISPMYMTQPDGVALASIAMLICDCIETALIYIIVQT